MKNSTHPVNVSSNNRTERLQKALRENLLKRKAQQRSRKAEVALEKPERETKPLDIPTTILVIIMLTFLTACGKKGDPDSPEPDNFPRQYPKG